MPQMDAALQAAAIRWELGRTGRKIGPYDLQIAAQAKVLELILVTNNLAEFRRVGDLPMEDWITD